MSLSPKIVLFTSNKDQNVEQVRQQDTNPPNRGYTRGYYHVTFLESPRRADVKL